MADTKALTGVNYMLTRLGLPKVAALGDSRAAVQALDLLDQATQEFQGEGWYFNTEEGHSIPVYESGWLEIPESFISVDLARSRVNVVPRDGVLYNLDDQTDIWTKPTNHIVDPDDYTTATWTAASTLTVIQNQLGFSGPRGSKNTTAYLDDTSGAAVQLLTQDISTLVDGTRYRMSGYFRNGPQAGAAKAQMRIKQGGVVRAVIAMDLTQEPPVLRTYLSGVAGIGGAGAMEDVELKVLDAPRDTISEGYLSNAALEASWVLVHGEWTYDSSLGTPSFEVMPSEDAGALVNTDMLIRDLQITEAVGSEELRIVHNLPYGYLDHVGQEYARAMALIPFQSAVLGDNSLATELRREMVEAKARLWKAQIDQKGTNYLHDNFSAGKFTTPHLNPLIGQGRGAAHHFFNNINGPSAW